MLEMINTLEVKGALDISREHGEISITTFDIKDGICDEVCLDLFELLKKFNGKSIHMTVESKEFVD